jgi:hypothetical protein
MDFDFAAKFCGVGESNMSKNIIRSTTQKLLNSGQISIDSILTMKLSNRKLMKIFYEYFSIVDITTLREFYDKIILPRIILP